MEQSYHFPQYSGTEEETRVTLIEYERKSGKPSSTTIPLSSELAQINTLMNRYCPALPGCKLDGKDYFRENGSRTYVDAGGVELATPEVKTPVDQAVYITANALLYEKGLRDFTIEKSRFSKKSVAAIFQRRVIDQKGNTWGCHDNFSVRDAIDYNELVSDQNKPISRIWLGFLMSRVIITGSMYIGSDRTCFSQKLSQPHENFNSYGYNNSMLRVNNEHGQRLEIRCCDINIQDWATVARIGGAGLLLAATQTSLVEELINSPHYDIQWPRDDDWNNIPIKKNLQLTTSDHLKAHIATQRFTFQTILNGYEKATKKPIPPIYKQIGKSILKFCDDLEAVAEEKTDIDTLVGRADWATKLYAIRRNMQKFDNRVLGDDLSKYYDMLYDQIKIMIKTDGSVSIDRGYGHKMSEKRSFYREKLSILETAIAKPPAKSRAAIRVNVAKSLGNQATSCNWHGIKNKTNGKTISFHFNTTKAN